MIVKNIWIICLSFLGYGFLAFWLPAICLGEYCKEKSITFKFFFYQAIANSYIFLSVLLLGEMGLLKRKMLWFMLVFLPVLICIVGKRKMIRKKKAYLINRLEQIENGTYGIKHCYRDIRREVYKTVKKHLFRFIKTRGLEVFWIVCILGWAVWFYGWYKLHNVAYGHTDEETHLYWISSLMNGELYPSGIYPFGVHTLMVALSKMFGFHVVRVYLNYPVWAIGLIMVSFYLVMKQVCSNRYIALAGWSLFVLLDFFHSTSYFRFQFAFPMEFGFIAMAGVLFSLIQYFKTRDKWDLYAFILSLTWTFYIHFYITIACGIICICFGIVFFIPMIKRKLLLWYFLGGIGALCISILPFAIEYSLGHPFERSIEWALNMSNTTKSKEAALEEEEETKEESKQPMSFETFLQKEAIYLSNNTLKNEKVSKLFMIIAFGMSVYSVLGILIAKEKVKYQTFLFFALLWEVGAILACSYYFDWKVVIEAKRMATFEAFFTIPLLCFPFEVIFYGLKILHKKVAEIGILLLGIGSLLFIYTQGFIKEYRYYQITISEADMKMALSLVEDKKEKDWTLLTTTNALSVIRYDGYHYEISNLLKSLDQKEESIYIPTKEIYVFLEYKPTSFRSDIRNIDRSDVAERKNTQEISPEKAQMDLEFGTSEDILHGEDSIYYFKRDIVMSKLYYWIETIKKVYPRHISFVYEDEQVCIYRIKQDPYFLLNLSVDYVETAKQDESY